MSRRKHEREYEIELDTIYYLVFVPKDGQKVNRDSRLVDPWCVKLPGNPLHDQSMVQRGISEFEKRRGVTSWKEIASKCTVESQYFP
jgi:hypothetical protein